MPTEAPWEVIRRAARRIETFAACATPGPWEPGERCVWAEDGANAVVSDGTDGKGGFANFHNADWVALLSPAVAEPLVTWLRYTAELWEMQDWAEKPDSQTLAAATLEFAGAVLGEVQR